MKLGLYKHSKSGRFYYVYDIQRDSENIKCQRVSYRALYGSQEKWSRPLEMFSEIVELPYGPCPRFEYLRSLTFFDHIKYFILGLGK